MDDGLASPPFRLALLSVAEPDTDSQHAAGIVRGKIQFGDTIYPAASGLDAYRCKVKMRHGEYQRNAQSDAGIHFDIPPVKPFVPEIISNASDDSIFLV